MVLHGLISAAVATIIGAVAWRGNVWTIGLTPVIPALIFWQPRRYLAWIIVVLYYAGASWPMMASTRAFWSLPSTSWLPYCAWLTAAVLLASPWLVLWSPNRESGIWRCPVALLAGALPPIGLIGWASPLTGAGVLFPGTAWFGVVATCVLPGAAIHPQFRCWAIPLAIVLITATNLTWTDPPVPAGWSTLNTSVDTARRSDPLVDFEATESLQMWAKQSNGRFLLAPESAVVRWNEAVSEMWQPTVEELTGRGRTLLFGTTVGNLGGTEYQNILLSIGADPSSFVQRNPVPFAMWKPFRPKDGTQLRLTGRGLIDLAGQRAAVLICYEQLLVWPMLHSAIERPTLILGIADDYWSRGTHVAQAQQACLRLWARLFSLPVITALNE